MAPLVAWAVVALLVVPGEARQQTILVAPGPLAMVEQVSTVGLTSLITRRLQEQERHRALHMESLELRMAVGDTPDAPSEDLGLLDWDVVYGVVLEEEPRARATLWVIKVADLVVHGAVDLPLGSPPSLEALEPVLDERLARAEALLAAKPFFPAVALPPLPQLLATFLTVPPRPHPAAMTGLSPASSWVVAEGRGRGGLLAALALGRDGAPWLLSGTPRGMFAHPVAHAEWRAQEKGWLVAVEDARNPAGAPAQVALSQAGRGGMRCGGDYLEASLVREGLGGGIPVFKPVAQRVPRAMARDAKGTVFFADVEDEKAWPWKHRLWVGHQGTYKVREPTLGLVKPHGAVVLGPNGVLVTDLRRNRAAWLTADGSTPLTPVLGNVLEQEARGKSGPYPGEIPSSLCLQMRMAR
jgi:hypothetical protein